MTAIKIYTRNILETSTVAATGTADTGYPEERLYDRSISLFWKATRTGAQYFEVDQGATGNKSIDFLAIERHNFNGEDMQWQWSTDNFSADINDAVTDWSQSDNNQIIKTLGTALTKRYWRVTVTSMTNPKCTEVFMSLGQQFEAQMRSEPRLNKVSNIRWQRTMGNVERSTKRGDIRRSFTYDLLLDSTDLSTFDTAMDDLDEFSLPFYITDHDGNTFFCRLLNDPVRTYDHNISKTRIVFSVIEIL